MLPYLIVLVVVVLLIWGLVYENKKRAARTPEEYERDVAEQQGQALASALSPFEYLKNKQAKAAHEMLLNVKHGHSLTMKKKDTGPDEAGAENKEE